MPPLNDARESAGAPPRKIVLLGTPRSGSTLAAHLMNEAGIAQYISELDVNLAAGEEFEASFHSLAEELEMAVDPDLPIMDKVVWLNEARIEHYLPVFDEIWLIYRDAAPTCRSFHRLRCQYRGVDNLNKTIQDLRSTYLNLITAVDRWSGVIPMFWLSYEDLLDPVKRSRIFGDAVGPSGEYRLNPASGVLGIGDPTTIPSGAVQIRDEARNAREARQALREIADIEELEFLAAVFLDLLEKKAAPAPERKPVPALP
jgi:hypothetical protein